MPGITTLEEDYLDRSQFWARKKGSVNETRLAIARENQHSVDAERCRVQKMPSHEKDRH